MEEKRTSDDVIKLLNKLYYGKRRSVGEVVAERNDKKVKLPLAGVDIDATVVGRVADVTIIQRFVNSFPENLEAVYTFPVAASASVYSVEMKVGDRVIKGKVEERSQARANYRLAIENGQRACLMEQERDEIFTVSVGNIPPEEEVSIEIKYSEALTFYEDGSTEIRLPLVVAPKYTPGEPVAREQVGNGVLLDTDRVSDASRISPPRLVDSFDPEVDLNVCVKISAPKNSSRAELGLGLKDLACSQYATRSSFDKTGTRVTLGRKNELMNRDFVLRWQHADRVLTSQFLSHRTGQKGLYSGMLSILPPVQEKVVETGRDLVFLLDRSGSMHGEKMISAKRACKFLLSSLGPRDRFAINAFDHENDWFSEPTLFEGKAKMCRATEEAVSAGLDFLTTVDAQGGTEIGRALIASCDRFERLKDCKEPIVVLITDGHIGDESDVLRLVQQKVSNIRVFTVGIDSAVNYGFLERLARLSGATSAFVNPGDELESTMRRIACNIGQPLIQEIKLEGINCRIEQSTIAPRMVPDLFSGRCADIFFQFEKTGGGKPRIEISGLFADGSPYRSEVDLDSARTEAISRLWARRVISDLEDEYRSSNGDRQEIQNAIVALSVEHSILCRFTAFSVIDKEKIDTSSLGSRQMSQPVHMPSGWAAFPVPGQMQSTGSSSGSWGGPAMPSCSGGWGAAPAGGGAYGNALWGAPDIDAVFGEAGFGYSDFGAPPSMQPVQKKEALPLEAAMAETGEYDVLSSSSDSASLRSGALGSLAHLYDSAARGGAGSMTLPLKRVIIAIDQFLLEWQSSWDAIEAGQSPDRDRLESAYDQLIQALADHPVSFELPKLASFLRLNYSNFAAALDAPNFNYTGVRAMRKQLNLGYEQVCAEAQAALTRALGKSGAFWQFTV
ncbi:VWA domain-containing protein [bacterium]|nr:VWA domain-containing protein [bacterium]